jgi:8-oxo-dGTP pyrophosphatase MutT (NUDIX family)
LKREKSCGALVYRYEDGAPMLLLLRHRHGGHWSFPKGHVEAGETEEQTAHREIFEETGVTVTLQDGFRHAVEYYPKPGVKKQVVYFLGEAHEATLVRQEEEISELHWAPFDEALRAVTFKNDRTLITKAMERLGIPAQK